MAAAAVLDLSGAVAGTMTDTTPIAPQSQREARPPGELPPQARAPYLDALVAYAQRDPGRFHVPGHKGGTGADPALRERLGAAALALDIPALTHGIDVGPPPTPFEQAQALAAQAWGAARTWFLINGASQGNQVASVALAHLGPEIVVQRNAHSSTIDGLVLSGLRPTFVAPELDPELQIAHCITPAALEAAFDRAPRAVAATVVSPTYFGAVADVAALADIAHSRGAVLVVDEAWGAHFAFHDSLPASALSAGADLVISSTHKLLGSLTQSAMLHLGPGATARLDPDVVDRAVTLVESTSPNSLLFASLDAARRHAAVDGRALLEETLETMAALRRRIGDIDGMAPLDDGVADRSGVVAYDPLRLAVDVRGTGASGYEIADVLREHDVVLELAGENVVVAVFGMGEPAAQAGERLVEALSAAARETAALPHRSHEPFAPPPPWGPLVLSPREAFLGPQEVVAADSAAGRVAAESLATYPPGIPNVLPGERLSAETIEYVQQTLRQGGSLRGASDRRLRTVRVVDEGRR